MNWTLVLHYVAAGYLFSLGLLGVAGIPLPGVHIDPATAMGAAIGILTAGKLGPQK